MTRILAIRMGAMGDIIHALPAVASLKHGFPHCRVTWIVEPKWTPLLEGNPFVDEVLPFDRRSLRSIQDTHRRLHEGFDLAVDFQGLIKSALVAAFSHSERIAGFDSRQVRERPAAWFYSTRRFAESAHMVDRYLELAQSAGAASAVRSFPLPQGSPEGILPSEPFVLANPLAGWGSKQWPLERYGELGRRLRREMGLPLVLNVPPNAGAGWPEDTAIHVSGLRGLIDATRRAAAVVGIDSGPLHLAAALGKPGVAIFGPTDPARNGPYGSPMAVLRSARAQTSYKRNEEPDPSMLEIETSAVFDALKAQLHAGRTAA